MESIETHLFILLGARGFPFCLPVDKEKVVYRNSYVLSNNYCKKTSIHYIVQNHIHKSHTHKLSLAKNKLIYEANIQSIHVDHFGDGMRSSWSVLS